MGDLGLAGAVRGKVKRTTVADPAAARPADLVSRRFGRLAPDRLWVADITYVSTWSGWVYVAFCTDAYARRILGWSVNTTMSTDLVLNAIEQAIWTRGHQAPAASTGWCTTPTAAASTPRSGSANASPPPGSDPRSGPSGPPMTTPWPRPSTACSRPS
jgi:transposase InsO family protein